MLGDVEVFKTPPFHRGDKGCITMKVCPITPHADDDGLRGFRSRSELHSFGNPGNQPAATSIIESTKSSDGTRRKPHQKNPSGIRKIILQN